MRTTGDVEGGALQLGLGMGGFLEFGVCEQDKVVGGGFQLGLLDDVRLCLGAQVVRSELRWLQGFDKNFADMGLTRAGDKIREMS